MGTINPTGKQIKALANHPEDTPFVMVNLLKFKPVPEGGRKRRDPLQPLRRQLST